MNPLASMALRMIQSNPNLKNNQMAQELVSCIQSGDNSRGEQLANNLLNTYGISKEDGLSQARNFFHI